MLNAHTSFDTRGGIALVRAAAVRERSIEAHIGIVNHSGKLKRAGSRNARICRIPPLGVGTNRPVGIVRDKIDFVHTIRRENHVQVDRHSNRILTPEAVNAKLNVRRVLEVDNGVFRSIIEYQVDPSAQFVIGNKRSILLRSVRHGIGNHQVVGLPLRIVGNQHVEVLCIGRIRTCISITGTAGILGHIDGVTFARARNTGIVRRPARVVGAILRCDVIASLRNQHSSGSSLIAKADFGVVLVRYSQTRNVELVIAFVVLRHPLR